MDEFRSKLIDTYNNLIECYTLKSMADSANRTYYAEF